MGTLPGLIAGSLQGRAMPLKASGDHAGGPEWLKSSPMASGNQPGQVTHEFC